MTQRHLRRLRPLLRLARIVFHRLAWHEAPQMRAVLQDAPVDKDVGTTALGDDETVAPARVKPADGPLHGEPTNDSSELTAMCPRCIVIVASGCVYLGGRKLAS